jgi:hypothetical protein
LKENKVEEYQSNVFDATYKDKEVNSTLGMILAMGYVLFQRNSESDTVVLDSIIHSSDKVGIDWLKATIERVEDGNIRRG